MTSRFAPRIEVPGREAPLEERMSDTKTKKPPNEVWMVENLASGRSRWTRVGRATPNKDGTFSITLEAAVVPGAHLNVHSPAPLAAQLGAESVEEG